MQRIELRQHELDELVPLGSGNLRRHPASHGVLRRAVVRAHDGSNHLGQRLAVAQPEQVRRHEGLLDGHVLLAGPFAGPDEDVAQQFHPVQFIHASMAST